MTFNKKLKKINPTTKEEIEARAKNDGWLATRIRLFWSKKVKIPAPMITGIAKKKDNLKASFLSIPKNNATDIVIPLRDIPGNIANAWINPIASTDL